MFIIADNDIPIVKKSISQVIDTLNCGIKRVDCDIDIGDDIEPLTATGYWVGDVLRIDLRIKR